MISTFTWELAGLAASAFVTSAGQKISILNALSTSEIDVAFATMVQQDASALLGAMADPFLNNRREQIVALALDEDLPDLRMATDAWRGAVVGGVQCGPFGLIKPALIGTQPAHDNPPFSGSSHL